MTVLLATELKWAWLLVAVPAVLVLLVLWWSRPPRRRGIDGTGSDDLILVAHASRVRALPRFRALVRRQTLLTGYRSVAVLVLCAGALLVAARPQSTQVLQPDNASRDVMLCLDASGSMAEYNVEVIEQMRAIASFLKGDRVGLTIFDGSSVRVFPLTDDFEFVLDQLDEAEEAFSDAGNYEYTAGTNADNGLSLLSDGLVTCAQGFDRTDEDRGRAIIVSSDNDPIGEPIFTLPEAAEYAARRDIVVHAVASPQTGEGAPRTEFEEVAASTGGTFSVLDEDGSSKEIVARIQQLEEKRVEEPPQTVVREEPVTGTVVAGVGLGLLVLGWLAELVVRRRRA